MGTILDRRRVMGGSPKINWAEEYLTFEALESGTFQFTNAVEYSLNNGAWTSLAASTATPTLAAGDLIRWKATITPTSSAGVGTFSSTGRYNAMGNPQSLLLGDNFKSPTNGVGHYGHYRLFYNNTNLVSAINLRLIDITWAWNTGNSYYEEMFYGCSNLIDVCEIESSTPKSSACRRMFYGCSSLTAARINSAVQLSGPSSFYAMYYNCSSLISVPTISINLNNGSQACQQMFYGCSSLVDASTITITGISTWMSCASMFEGCVSLEDAPDISTISKFNSSVCLSRMFYGCTSLETAPTLPNIDLNSGCYNSMFYGCTSLSAAPALPATTLATDCYTGMFQGCTSLTTAPVLPATTMAIRCYMNMFNGCTALTTAPELPATTLAAGCYTSMFLGCANLNYIKCLATDVSPSSCLYAWVNGVAASGTFVKHPDMNDWPTGMSGIPNGWTVEDAVID